LDAIAMMDTVFFTDHDIVVIAIVSSSIALVLAVLAVSMGVEQCIGRLESKIRQAMWSDVNHQ
jgi:Trk K+ transport system NAD-binding subunit